MDCGLGQHEMERAGPTHGSICGQHGLEHREDEAESLPQEMSPKKQELPCRVGQGQS